jgi:hypothetical protein
MLEVVKNWLFLVFLLNLVHPNTLVPCATLAVTGTTVPYALVKLNEEVVSVLPDVMLPLDAVLNLNNENVTVTLQSICGQAVVYPLESLTIGLIELALTPVYT